MRTSNSIFNLFLSVALLYCLWIQPPAVLRAAEKPGVQLFAITGVKIFDGRGTITEGSVVVKGQTIVSVGKDVKIPAGATIIPAKGHTLLPGLIDCHTHAILPDMLKQALIFGVTTELDMFMDHKLAADIKKQLAEGRGQDMADLFSAGTLVTAPGGHGTEYGMQIPTITDAAKAEEFVLDRIKEGSDYIKIVFDDMRSHHLMPTISKEVMAAVIKAAHKHGKLAVVHISRLKDALTAIECGADGLVHLFSDGEENDRFGQIAAKHHIFVIPTLPLVQSVLGIKGGAELARDSYIEPYLFPMDITTLSGTYYPGDDKKVFYQSVRKAIVQLKSAGVPILAGSDAPNTGTLHGASLHKELEMLVDAGLTPVEALASATSVPAEIFSLGKRGRIAPGYRANLLLVKGDPTKNIKDTRKITSVWKLGKKLDRSIYLKEVKVIKDQEAKLRNAPPPPGSESGLVSDFEEEKVTAEFGAGWMVSTDVFRGGKSTAQMKWVQGGANGSKGALMISGEIKKGAAFPWAGVMFIPGKTLFAPVNLAQRKAVTFQVKGKGKHVVYIFSRKLGFIPAIVTYQATEEWQQVILPFAKFKNFDGYGITGLFFGGNPVPGQFSFTIDDVKFE